MRPCELRRAASQTVDDRPAQRRAPPAAGLRHRLRRQPSLHRPGASCSPTTPRPRRRAASGCGAEGAGSAATTSTPFGRTRASARARRSRRLVPAHRRRRLRQRGPAPCRSEGIDLAAGPRRARAGRLPARCLASRSGRQRVSLERRRDGAPFRRRSLPRCASGAIATAPTRRSSRRTFVDRRFGSGRWGDLLPAGPGAGAGRSSPTSLRRSPEHQGEAELLARFPSERVRPGRYQVPRHGRRWRRQPRLHHPAKRRQRDGPARAAEAPDRLRARLRLGGRSGRRLKVPYGARAGARRPSAAPRRRRIGGAPGCGSRSVLPRGSLAGPGVRHRANRSRRPLPRPARHRAISPASGSRSQAARCSPATAPRRCDCWSEAGVELSASRRALRTGEALRLSGIGRSSGSARLPSRGKLVMIEYLERARGAGQPVLLTRTGREGRFRRPLPLPLRQRRGADSSCGRWRLPSRAGRTRRVPRRR